MCKEQDKTIGYMKNGVAMARKPVTSIVERTSRGADFGGSRDKSRVPTQAGGSIVLSVRLCSVSMDVTQSFIQNVLLPHWLATFLSLACQLANYG